MSLKSRIVGKWVALSAYVEIARHFRNWREVWAAYRAGRPVPPLTFRDGLTLYHGPDDDAIWLFREQFVIRPYTRGGFYRPRPGDTVLDIGANIGGFALYLEQSAPGIRVHCFEPAAGARACLERTIRENELGEFVSVYPVAVSDREGVAMLKNSSNSVHRSFFANETVDSAVEESVRCIGLEGAMELSGVDQVDLLKIDAEGSEIEILEAADPGLWRRVKRVAIEYHDNFRPGCLATAERVLKGQGFRIVDVTTDPPTFDYGVVRATR